MTADLYTLGLSSEFGVVRGADEFKASLNAAAQAASDALLADLRRSIILAPRPHLNPESLMSDESNESTSTDRTNADLRPSAEHAGSVDYAIGGALATFTHGHGWTSNDGLCAKHLNRLTAERHMDGASLDEAHAIITAEYPQAVRVEPV